ncbi:MAG: hypothetical protein IT269_04085 [Saprospiraceae bacterium]|nr:hypothetical protein [Saprospiraceae bacterium]
MNPLRLLASFLLLLAFSGSLFSQKLNMSISTNGGVSWLWHDTDFKTTPLYDQFEYVQELFEKEGIDYTWEQFVKSNELRTSFIQPRIGFSAHATYGDLPLMLIVDALSSTSGFDRASYSATLGMGKTFEIGDNIGMYTSILGGLKYTKDPGFGSSTLIHSVGDKSLREELSSYFNAEQALGPTRGHFFVLRGSLMKSFGDREDFSIGVEGYGELDLVNRTLRKSRMTNAGAHIFMRFRLLGKSTGYGYYPSAGGK